MIMEQSKLKMHSKRICFIWIILGGYIMIHGQTDTIRPVTPNASSEAIKLLQYLYSISGKKTLSGQHCNPLAGSTRLASLHKHTGHYPAVFGQDFGFSEPGSWDGINFRQQIVDEAIKRYHEGFIITIMWHAVPPTEEEPVEFRESIMGDLTDEEWNDLMTPGTEIHERWKSQVDIIAWFLKQIRNAGVPVIWRPYHEMNGQWFWWGQKPGENGYKKLYRMLYDRLVNYHRLNNLLWVYNVNEIKLNVDPYKIYYPGDDVVDILATDVYTEGFDQNNYKQIQALAKNKPIALGEVGDLPTEKKLKNQPKWVWFMSWSDFSNHKKYNKEYQEIYDSEYVITYEELPWVKLDEIKIHFPLIK